MLDHAVLVDTRLVGEGILANDGLVALHVNARHAGDQPAGPVNLRCVDPALQGKVIPPRAEVHDDLFQGGVPGALPDAVDGTLRLPGSSSYCLEAVGYCHA